MLSTAQTSITVTTWLEHAFRYARPIQFITLINQPIDATKIVFSHFSVSQTSVDALSSVIGANIETCQHIDVKHVQISALLVFYILPVRHAFQIIIYSMAHAWQDAKSVLRHVSLNVQLTTWQEWSLMQARSLNPVYKHALLFILVWTRQFIV